MARAAAGLAPPVETATARRPRRTTAGRMKSQCAGSSAAFTQTPRARPSALTAAVTSKSPVAVNASWRPARSSAR